MRRSNSTIGYIAHLNSRKWKTIRKTAIKLADGKCSECESTKRLEVHHLSYDSFGDELQEHLSVLCIYCHRKVHGMKPPKIKRKKRKKKKSNQKHFFNPWNADDRKTMKIMGIPVPPECIPKNEKTKKKLKSRKAPKNENDW